MTPRIAIASGLLVGHLLSAAQSPGGEPYETASPEAVYDLRAALADRIQPANPLRIDAVEAFAGGIEIAVTAGWPAEAGGPGREPYASGSPTTAP